MSFADSLSECERGDLLAVTETDLPTRVGADHAHREQNGRHRGAMAPLKEEVGDQTGLGGLLEHGRPDVDVGLHRLLDAVES